MGKIISVFSHKGGVGKTTFVYNMAFMLAELDKKVLVIDADSQMNLTACVFGFSDSMKYSHESKEQWSALLKKHFSLRDWVRKYNDLLLKDELTEFNTKTIFTRRHPNNKAKGSISLISSSIDISKLELDMYDSVTSGAEYSQKYLVKIQESINNLAKDYDFVLIDTPPSAGSVLNGLLVLSSNYLIVPATPTIFSLQAIDNLYYVISEWETIFKKIEPNGFSINTKFLGLLVQMSKRQEAINKTKEQTICDITGNKIWSDDTATWATKANQSVSDFVSKIALSRFFFKNFEDTFLENRVKTLISFPYVVRMLIDFSAGLRSKSDKNGLPIVALPDNIIDYKDTDGKHRKSYKLTKDAYMAIAKSFFKLP